MAWLSVKFSPSAQALSQKVLAKQPAALLHEAVVHFLACKRSGTAATKMTEFGIQPENPCDARICRRIPI